MFNLSQLTYDQNSKSNCGGIAPSMWTAPQSVLQKIGIVIYGLVVGLGTALGTSAAFLVLGIAISLFAQSTGWIRLGEYQLWLPIIGMEYGFFLGLIIGALVCWRVWRARFEW